jgi:hypothetical protein
MGELLREGKRGLKTVIALDVGAGTVSTAGARMRVRWRKKDRREIGPNSDEKRSPNFSWDWGTVILLMGVGTG